ncbi:MAG: hypothetical protein ACREKF_04880 [Candidatus Methylomirabilales bacterium]
MRKTLPFSLRLSPEILKEIRALAKQLARPSSYIVSTLIEEGLRQRRCPGVVFTDGPTGRRATVAGSGIDVWEAIRLYKACKEDVETLARALPQLSRRQLDAALHYYRCYPQEIEERLAREQTAEEELRRRFPLVKPYRT